MKTKTELLKNLKKQINNISCDFIGNYDIDKYLDDAINEFAESRIDIYYSDLDKWITQNSGYFDDSVEEFGYCGDYYKQIQMAQYLSNSEDLWADKDYILKAEIIYNLDIEEYSDTLIDLLDEISYTHDTIAEAISEYKDLIKQL